MAFVTLSKSSLKNNYDYLTNLFKENGIEWTPVVKLLCGNKTFLDYVLSLGDEQVADSRLTHLKIIKELNPSKETIYIKPPAEKYIPNIVRYADVSCNTEFYTIKLLNEEAKQQDKIHRIIIMIELGDLREGIMGESLMGFYKKIFELSNIKVVGIGTNLNCLSGVMPSKDKLVQLSLYEQLIEAKFGRKIEGVSGGSSVMVPLLLKGLVPKGVNHFRVGETLYFGVDLFDRSTIEGMKNDVFKLHSQIIEITEKPSVPYGKMEANPSGEKLEIDENEFGKTQKRGIIDVGLLDISKSDFLEALEHDVKIIGASSDMLVVDLSGTDYKVGDILTFKMTYMGALRVMNSKYIKKELID